MRRILLATLIAFSVVSIHFAVSANAVAGTRVIPGPTTLTAGSAGVLPRLTALPVPNPVRNSVEPSVEPNVKPYDFKKQAVTPPKFETKSKQKQDQLLPKLMPVITQMARHQDVFDLGKRVMPFVYVRGDEVMVAEFELAIEHLEIADQFLYKALFESLDVATLRDDAESPLTLAREHIDEASLSIELLHEMALIDL